MIPVVVSPRFYNVRPDHVQEEREEKELRQEMCDIDSEVSVLYIVASVGYLVS